MPEGLTHLAAAYILAPGRVRRRGRALFLLGALLPDLLLRGARLFLMEATQQDFFEFYFVPLHSPFTCLWTCAALAQVFDKATRMLAFKLLYGGCLSHFLLDLMQRTITGRGLTWESYGGYHWLYPFSWLDFQIGLLWAEDTSYLLLFFAPVVVGIFLRDYTRKAPVGRSSE